MYTRSTIAYELSGWWFQTTTSASLPTSSEPTRLSTRSCLAGLMVTRASASSSVSPPHLMDLAASVFKCRESSALSELTDVSTPLRVISAAL